MLSLPYFCVFIQDVESLSHFAKALLVNQSLTNVDMLFNKIGYQGALALQPALTKVGEKKTSNSRIKKGVAKQFGLFTLVCA